MSKPETAQHDAQGRDFVHHLASQEERLSRRLRDLEARVEGLERAALVDRERFAQGLDGFERRFNALDMFLANLIAPRVTP